MNYKEFKEYFFRLIGNRENIYHPLVWINGNPKIGKNISIGGFSEINANESKIEIGDNCDIASFVAINVADSHKKCIELIKENERKPIKIGNNVFIGSHCFIGGGTVIGHHSVIGAGVVLKGEKVPPYSLVTRGKDNIIIREGFYNG